MIYYRDKELKKKKKKKKEKKSTCLWSWYNNNYKKQWFEVSISKDVKQLRLSR